jgi:hypothetical protein
MQTPLAEDNNKVIPFTDIHQSFYSAVLQKQLQQQQMVDTQ